VEASFDIDAGWLLGAADPADLVANTIGAGIGVLAARMVSGRDRTRLQDHQQSACATSAGVVRDRGVSPGA
jgi:hypothetical protein